MSFVWKKVRILAPENEATTKCVYKYTQCACARVLLCTSSLRCSVYRCMLGWDCQLAISLCGFSPLETVQISFSFGFGWLNTVFSWCFICFCVHHCTASRVRKKIIMAVGFNLFSISIHRAHRRSHAVQKSRRVSYFVIYCWKLHGSSLKLLLVEWGRGRGTRHVAARVRNTCSEAQVFCHNKRIANNNNYYNLFWLKAKAFSLKMQESTKKRACINLSPYSNCY